jgi:G3E family GTPase
MNPDYLFLEPSEMIVTKELRNVTKMGLRDIQYDIGPFITLIDGPSFSFNWEERPKLILGQMQDADRVALSRRDMIDSKQIEHIRKILDVAGNNLLLTDIIDGPRDIMLGINEDHKVTEKQKGGTL